MEKTEKTLLSLLVAAVFILNMSVPVVYAYVNAGINDGSAVYCNLFCNLTPANDRDSKLPTCPHHAKEEARKKKLSGLFECKIVPSSCHDNATLADVSSLGDPFLLSKHPINQALTASFLDFYNSTISSQTVISFLEKPPSKLRS